MNNILIASDHGGFQTKEIIIGYLISQGYNVEDLGCYSADSVDYPDYAHKLAQEILKHSDALGIALCGSANGISIALNRHKGVRAAICWKAELATLAREHNNANVCSIPGRFVSPEDAISIVDAFLNATFEGGRHQTRIDKIEQW